MATRRKAQIAAERRYDEKRRDQVKVLVRLSDSQTAWLEQRRRDAESRAAALRRLSGMPEQ